MKKNEMTIFSNDEFGKVRTVVIDHEPWFVGRDVAYALGYAKPENALATHVDSEDKDTLKQGTLGGEQKMTIINESGLYALIFGSHLPKARAFKRWVTAEVLPALRKKGYYAIRKHKDDEWNPKFEKLTKNFIKYWICETIDYYEHIVGITRHSHLSGYALDELYHAHADRLDRAFNAFMSFTMTDFRSVIADPTLLMPQKDREKVYKGIVKA